MAAGYSGTPLPRKLGIEEGQVVALVDAPPHAADLLVPLPAGVELRSGARGKPDMALVFCPTRSAFRRRVPQLWRMAFPDRSVWICWPKKSSPHHVDMTEDDVRAHALPLGLVDVKVCAVDADWSGLKLMVRRELRDG